MIEEIFITANEKVLIGDINLYPKKLSYPTSVSGDKQITQLKVNNVVLGILYSNIDSFTALQFLEKLKEQLESKFYNLNAQHVLDNYFIIREMVNRLFLENLKGNFKLPALSTNEVHIDVIEIYNGNIQNNIYLCDVFGYCFIKPRFNEKNFLKLIIKKDKNINYLSDYKILDRFNKLEMELNVYDKDLQILKYHTNSNLPFKIQYTSELITISADNIYFESLDIIIPLKYQSNEMILEQSKGAIKFIEEEEKVIWSFKKHYLVKENLKIKIGDIKDLLKTIPIQVKSKICKTDKNILKIEKAICLDNQSIDIWIKYDICGGNINFWEQ